MNYTNYINKTMGNTIEVHNVYIFSHSKEQFSYKKEADT